LAFPPKNRIFPNSRYAFPLIAGIPIRYFFE